MGYGINKKFLCKLDPEYNSNGSYDFCSTSQKQVVSRVHNTQLNTYYISKYIDGKKEEGTKKDFYIYSDGSGYTKTRNQPEKWVEHNPSKDFFNIFWPPYTDVLLLKKISCNQLCLYTNFDLLVSENNCQKNFGQKETKVILKSTVEAGIWHFFSFYRLIH